MEEAPGPPAPPRAPAAPSLLRARRSRQQEGEAPDAHVAEEGKRVIRELVARQTDVTLSLQEQQARERHFTHASAVLPLPRVPPGATSLHDFHTAAEAQTRREELAAMGLSPEDVQLLLEHENREVSTGRLTEPEVLARAERLQSLQDILASRSRSSSGGTTSSASRHLNELVATLLPDGTHAQLVRMGLVGAGAGAGGTPAPFREAASRLPGHPMQRLHGMERSLLDLVGAERPPAATSRKRRRMRRVIDRLQEGDETHRQTPQVAENSRMAGGSSSESKSLWDLRSPRGPAASVKTSGGHVERRAHGPHRPKQYTIRDGQIIELGAGSHSTSADTSEAERRVGGETAKGQRSVITKMAEGYLSIADLRENRLSLEEIRQLPRFTNYESGEESRVLYVKNLPDSVTEEDLASVFGAFRQPSGPNLEMRLCGGRMRGQAFITFPCEEIATVALSEANGYRLKGRPMIVQYARNQSQPK